MASSLEKDILYDDGTPATILSAKGLLQMFTVGSSYVIIRGVFNIIDRVWCDSPELLRKYRAYAKAICLPFFCRSLGTATSPFIVTFLGVDNDLALGLSLIPSILYYYLVPPEYFEFLWTKSDVDEVDYSSASI